MNRMTTSLSLDLDDEWSYMRTRGDPAWREYPSYLAQVVPRILEFLDNRNLKITFFVVGKDAEAPANRHIFEALVEHGHAIANHSYHHEPWLHLFSAEELSTELEKAETAIEQATGVKVDGFRGPGYSFSATTLRVLEQRGYRYDATTFPSALNPLARAYFLATSGLSREQRQKRQALFGSFSDAFRPVKPYCWDLGDGSLRELPVTTMPLLKLPMHFSYLLYLAQFSRPAACWYFELALALCRLTGTGPSLLLHPLDFLGVEDNSRLSYFPGMRMQARKKLDTLGECIDRLTAKFDVIDLAAHLDQMTRARVLPMIKPRFRHEAG